MFPINSKPIKYHIETIINMSWPAIFSARQPSATQVLQCLEISAGDTSAGNSSADKLKREQSWSTAS